MKNDEQMSFQYGEMPKDVEETLNKIYEERDVLYEQENSNNV